MFLQVFKPTAIELGPLSIEWYAVFIVGGIILADRLFQAEGKRQGFDEDTLFDLLFWSLIFGFIGARLYYVVFQWDYYKLHPEEIIAIWHGGAAIYGGVLAGLGTIYSLARKKQINFLTLLDMAVPPLLIAQAIGRWGNFMNQEAHGGRVAREFLEGLHLPAWLIEQMKIDGHYYQPTFLYESLWNLLGFILIMSLRHKPRLFRQGEIAAFYCVWYGLGRVFIEGMRTDSLYLGPLRVSQWLSALLILVGISYVLYIRSSKRTPVYYMDASPLNGKGVL